MSSKMHNKKVKHQKGLTLIEVLLAMIIGIILTTALVQITDSFRNSSSIERAQIQIQDTGHFAMYYLTRALRHNGYLGGRDADGWGDHENTSDNSFGFTVKFDKINTNSIFDVKLRAFEVDGTGSFSPAPALNDMIALRDAKIVKPNSDVISVVYVQPAYDTLSQDMSTPSSNVVLTGNPTVVFNTGDLVYIGNKSDGDIFRVTNDPADTDPPELAHANSENTSNEIKHAFKMGETGEETKIHHFRGDTFFIGDTGRTNKQSGEAIYALYQLALDDDPDEAVEIIEGVEHMELLYGIDQSGESIRYVSADNAAFDPNKVIGVKIALLVESGQPVLSSNDTKDYQLLNVAVGPSQAIKHPGNTHMRRVFTTAANLKNAASYLFD